MTELARHKGKVILLKLPVGNLCFELTPEGSLTSLTDFDTPSLELEVSAEVLSSLGAGPDGLREQAMKSVKITGDADLAQLLGRLVGQIHWGCASELCRASR